MFPLRSNSLLRYTYAMNFASIITITIALAEYWNPSNAVLVIFPLILGPILVICINLLNVKVASCPFRLLHSLTRGLVLWLRCMCWWRIGRLVRTRGIHTDDMHQPWR